MSRKNGKEISVAEAAECLKVTERTVINFIRSKQLKATKVGKRWFVDEVSVRNLSSDTDVDGKVSEFEKVVVELPEKTKGFSDSRQSSRLPFENQASGHERASRSLAVEKARPGLQGLSCYKIACEIFSNARWKVVCEHSASESLPMISGTLLATQLAALQLRILEALGAGYHMFGGAKVSQYGHARAATGSLLALLLADSNVALTLEAERIAIETKLLPALVALQRTAEQRTQFRRNPS